jgi:hypothetical protein
MYGSKAHGSQSVGRALSGVGILTGGLLLVGVVGSGTSFAATTTCIATNGAVVMTNVPTVHTYEARTRSAGPVQASPVGATTVAPTPSPPKVTTTTMARSSRVVVAATSSSVTVQFHGFPAAAQTAFQAAADIWAADLGSPVPITVDATWAPATDGNILAGTAPTLLRQVGGSVWYPQALADRLSSQTVDPGVPDISINVNSTPNGGWYLGTDGRPGTGQFDLTTVALHEMAHGLGIFGLFNVDTQGVGSVGAGLSGMNVPAVFDNEVQTASGQGLVASFANPSSPLGATLQSGSLVFGGPQAKLGNGGVAPRLFAPSTWQPGSSAYHTDFAMFPAGSVNSLMDAGLPPGTAIHDPGPVVEGILDDLGWTSLAGRPTNVAAVSGSGQATVRWSPPVFTGGSPIAGYVVTAVGSDGQVVAQQNAPASPMALAGLAAGASYGLTVQAVNSVGRGPSSSSVSVAITTAGGVTTTTSTTTPSSTTSTTTAATTTTVASTTTTIVSAATIQGAVATTTTTIAKCAAAAGTGAVKAATSTRGGQLASSGASEPIPMSLTGMVLILAGLGLVLATRRRLVELSGPGRSRRVL